MSTRSQDWSKSAFECVGASGKAQDGSVIDKYRIACNKTPSLIHQSGLLQALVFQAARGDHERTYVADLARTYLSGQSTHVDLITRVQTADLNEYMAMTHDLAEIAQWFRRFAQILLPRTPDAKETP